MGAGNRILSVANPDRYRSLQMMVSIQENNEIKIKRCIARASAYDLPVKCDLTVKPLVFNGWRLVSLGGLMEAWFSD